MTLIGSGQANAYLNDADISDIINNGAEQLAPDGKKILVIIPDHTRTCPLGRVVRGLHAAIAPRAKKLDFIVALGTHPPLSETQIDRLLDIEPGRRDEVLPGSEVFNHNWNATGELRKIGVFTAERVREISGGASAGFEKDIDVTINKRIFEYDLVVITGPVFPHEVVGFSGGVKYFFPGICGEELLNFFHWLGALVTIPKMIGVKLTPVRDLLDAAFEMVEVETRLLAMVVAGAATKLGAAGGGSDNGYDLAGLYFGDVREAWSAAADLSDKVHIIYSDRPFESILSCAPRMYDDLWTGGKCMYKMECVVADGGELIIYAPHIREVSAVHGRIIEEIGYHTLAYFLANWEKYKDYPWGLLAHSTHVRGIGVWEDGIEKPRVKVTLATSIPEETCRRINMGYRDPDSIDVDDWRGKESAGRLYVPKAGEMLYRLKNPPAWQ
ncbi:MAG: DUF2088 domain-containing protein [Planctomycetes bacterium]|nr:DUF2088 domain-containing protein [Planctomycetota bacterium]